MRAAEFPPNEIERLTALRIYEVLDTAPEAEFDDLTRLAANICDTPIALVSLVDASRQWFKSRQGLDVAETSRDAGFCPHVILGDGVFEVNDALQDQRFADNPLVLGAPNIRFYAGMPLTAADGFNLGAVCVIDRVPRQLNDQQREALRVISRQVVHLLELRVAVRRLDREAAFRQAILDSAAASIISTTPEGIITSISHGAEKMLGYAAAEMVDKKSPVIIHDAKGIADRAEELTKQLGRPVAPGFATFLAKVGNAVSETREWTYVRKDGSRFPVRLSVSQVADASGSLIGYLGIARDVTELEQARRDLERLAAELKRSNEDLAQFASSVSHDLQEPLRVITGYLELLERRYKSKLDKDAREFIGFAVDGAARLHGMIRDLLTYSRVGAGKEAPAKVDLSESAASAIKNLRASIDEKRASVTVDPLPSVIGRAAEFTRLFQNLISNAIKFSGNRAPRVKICAKRIGGRIWAESEPGTGSTFRFSLPASLPGESG